MPVACITCCLLSAALPPLLLLALLCCRCCRDFTTAAIPWGEPDLSIVQGLLPAAGGTDGASNVLSISFDKMTYPVTVEGLHTVRAANPLPCTALHGDRPWCSAQRVSVHVAHWKLCAGRQEKKLAGAALAWPLHAAPAWISQPLRCCCFLE